MLKEKNEIFESGSIVCLKLMSGEEIICKVSSTSDKDITVHIPLQIMNSTQGLVLVPYIVMADNDAAIPIKRSAIVSSYLPNKQFLDGYEQQTSEIILPDTNIIAT